MEKFVKSNDDVECARDYRRQLLPKKCYVCEYDTFCRLFKRPLAEYAGYTEDEYAEMISMDAYDGIDFGDITNEEVYDIIGKLLGVVVTSIHTDHWEPTGVWICYK